MEASGFICIGRFASPNALIATSTLTFHRRWIRPVGSVHSFLKLSA